MKKFGQVLMWGLCLLLLSLEAKGENNPKPFVIPELTSWQGAEGVFVPMGRIVLPRDASREVEGVARAFATDYQTMFARVLKVQKGVRPRKGDFVFSLSPTDTLGAEGYSLAIGDKCSVEAKTPQGLYWASRSLLQISEQTPERTIPQGQSVDIPRYPLRGFLLDVARKYIPMSYLRQLVRIMAYYKMNTLQIHLNDNGFKQYFEDDWRKTSSAFRLESETYPELAAKGASYSKKEFVDLQILAEQNYVEIIPEIDVPAHTLAFAHLKPELGSQEYGADHLDLFKPETYAFVDALLAEYLSGDKPIFRGKRVNIGTDEYSNKEESVREKFRYFTDRYIRYVESFGKQACLWGSLTHAYGTTPVKSDNVLMMCWYNGYADPKAMKAAGYDLVSIPDGAVYIVPAAGYYQDYLDTRYLYDKWTPTEIGNQSFDKGDPAIKGGMFAVWNDHYGNGISTKDIHHRTMPALQMIALKTWTAHDTQIPYDRYEELRHKLSEAPGVNELGRWGLEPREVYSLAELRPNSQLEHTEIGYDYSVAFGIDVAEESLGTELLRSPHAVFYLRDPQSGKLGFARDGYLNTFAYTLPKEGKVQIRIEGTNKETRLYINGKLHERLGAETVHVLDPKQKLEVQYQSPDPFVPSVYRSKAKMHYQRTLFFPLERAGAFRSKVSDLKVYNYCLGESKP